MNLLLRTLGIFAIVAAMATAHPLHADAIVRRDDVGILAGPYNLAFFDRHNDAYRTSAAVHYAHAKQHDVLQLTPFDRHSEWDARFNNDVLAFLRGRPRIEPTME